MHSVFYTLICMRIKFLEIFFSDYGESSAAKHTVIYSFERQCRPRLELTIASYFLTVRLLVTVLVVVTVVVVLAAFFNRFGFVFGALLRALEAF